MKSDCLRLSVVPVSGSLYHSEGLGGSIQQVIIFSHRHYLSIFYKRIKNWNLSYKEPELKELSVPTENAAAEKL